MLTAGNEVMRNQRLAIAVPETPPERESGAALATEVKGPIQKGRSKPMRTAAIASIVFWVAPALAAEPKVLVRWDFGAEGNHEGWVANGHTAEAKVAKGCLSARVIDWDPMFIGPTFETPARHGQWIETRMRADHSGTAEFFWTNTLETQYGGFSPGKQTPFRINGDGRWHVYRVFPGWAAERKIIKLRLDLPRDKGFYEVDYVRVMEHPPGAEVEPVWEFEKGAEGWGFEDDEEKPDVRRGALTFRSGAAARRLLSPPVGFEAATRFFLALRMAADGGQSATVAFASDAEAGTHAHSFPVIADGEMHNYLVDLSGNSHWRGAIRLLTFEPSDAPKARVAIDFLRVTQRPQGHSELVVKHFGLADGLPRAGQKLSVAATIANRGSAPARKVRVAVELPRGLTTKAALTQELGDIWYGETRIVEWPVRAAKALSRSAELTVSADGMRDLRVSERLRIERGLGLPKADTVPEPKPAKTDYQVGVYYFPGFPTWSKWRPIADFPERKPLLGWYDESLPEIADWQIKWAVEHGVSFFAVDWYWCQGARHLEHWLHDAYLKSRYRRHLEFCLLWANHNPPKTHSEADLLAVTDYWLEHYFKLPEYLKVEGKPVVIMFSTYRLSQDLGTEAIAAAFEKMRERCRQAGLEGLYLVACTRADRKQLEQLKAQGYDAASGYNYPSLGSKGKRWHPYAVNIAAYRELWSQAADAKLLKPIPALSGGWDSRPWHGPSARVVHGRTPKLFERHCRDAKAFLDARASSAGPKTPHPGPLPEGEGAERMCIIEAWNEWGEGSYIGPHREHGFGYLEAIRKVFAPDSPKPLPVTPRDIGLGPYDVHRPEADASPKTAWDFARPADRADWRLSAQTKARPDAAALAGTSTGRDPIISGPAVRIPAESSPWLVVEMRTDQPDRPQLFWRTTTAPASENNSVRFDVPGDGQWHTHWVSLADCPYWTGLVTSLRFDPVNRPGVGFALRSLRFAKTKR